MITIPLKADEWAEALEGHPDRCFHDYILQGISHGFHISFDQQTGSAPRSCRRNMCSAYEHPEVVSEHLAQECRAARVLSPFPSSPLPQLQVSRGSVPGRERDSRRQVECPARISSNTSASRRPSFAGHEMAGAYIHRCHSAVWPPLSTPYIFSRS